MNYELIILEFVLQLKHRFAGKVFLWMRYMRHIVPLPKCMPLMHNDRKLVDACSAGFIFTPTDFTVLMSVFQWKHLFCHLYTLQDNYIAFGQVISILHLSFCSTLNSTEQLDFTHFLIVDFSLMHFLKFADSNWFYVHFVMPLFHELC